MKKKSRGPITDNRKESISKEEKKSKAYKAILRFVLLFIGLLILLIILFSLTADKFLSPTIDKIEIATAHVVGLVLNLFGMGAQVSQKFLSLKNFSVEIIAECTGLFEVFIFLAAILAYPASFKKKLWGVSLGIPFIFLVNILRMVVITVVSNYRPSAFEFMHLYFWQVALILILLSAWILWIEKIVRSERF